jgi:hypothetical protein
MPGEEKKILTGFDVFRESPCRSKDLAAEEQIAGGKKPAPPPGTAGEKLRELDPVQDRGRRGPGVTIGDEASGTQEVALLLQPTAESRPPPRTRFRVGV